MSKIVHILYDARYHLRNLSGVHYMMVGNNSVTKIMKYRKKTLKHHYLKNDHDACNKLQE